MKQVIMNYNEDFESYLTPMFGRFGLTIFHRGSWFNMGTTKSAYLEVGLIELWQTKFEYEPQEVPYGANI